MSTIVGLFFGLALSFFFKKFDHFNKTPIREASIILIVGYLAYLTAEIFELSGIISLFTCGVIMGHYTFLNISAESQKGTVWAFDTAGYLAEAFVFGYLGKFGYNKKVFLWLP
jgi:NhaP-type Na+/H+ or K+/H+ antiporter